jgi:hypothetical protein
MHEKKNIVGKIILDMERIVLKKRKERCRRLTKENAELRK